MNKRERNFKLSWCKVSESKSQDKNLKINDRFRHFDMHKQPLTDWLDFTKRTSKIYIQ